MHFEFKSWKVTVLVLLMVSFLTSLGFWQLYRYNFKIKLFANYAAKMAHEPLSADQLKSKSNLQFFWATLNGHYDNAHTFLLDNKTLGGAVGYEIYTPFIVDEIKPWVILIDRGFVVRHPNRHILPEIPAITKQQKVTGLLDYPPRYFVLGGLTESKNITWPLRVQYIDPQRFSAIAFDNQMKFLPYILSLTPGQAKPFAMEWKITTLSPERHMGYALQWFALALTLLILFLAVKFKVLKFNKNDQKNSND